MDYSDDTAWMSSPSDQGARMDAMVALYKPTLWNSNNVFPDIKVNGSDGPISVSSTDPLQVAVTLFPGNQDGTGCGLVDWCPYLLPGTQ